VAPPVSRNTSLLVRRGVRTCLWKPSNRKCQPEHTEVVAFRSGADDDTNTIRRKTRRRTPSEGAGRRMDPTPATSDQRPLENALRPQVRPSTPFEDKAEGHVPQHIGAATSLNKTTAPESPHPHAFAKSKTDLDTIICSPSPHGHGDPLSMGSPPHGHLSPLIPPPASLAWVSSSSLSLNAVRRLRVPTFGGVE